MGRMKKYTAAALNKAVKRYFAGISRYVPVMESYDTGKKDNMGHIVYAEREVINQLGERVLKLNYLTPPSLGGLCLYLGISRETWSEYSRDRETAATCRYARELIQLWNEEELLTRKDVKGIIFNLQNNFGYTDKKDVQLHDGVEEYLRGINENGGEQEF